ncbi:MAG: hypothetical protein Q8876_07155 [Bacillota bacterium]|nr:hypothetical protein [Bacillota bacterium]
MKKNSMLIITLPTLVIALVVSVIILFLNTNKYVPISKIVSGTDQVISRECIKIDMTYSDLSGEGKGKQVTKTITDKTKIEETVNYLSNTFCWRDNELLAAGATNVTVKFYLKNYSEPITINTLGVGQIRVNDKVYSTSNMLGSYFAKLVYKT